MRQWHVSVVIGLLGMPASAGAPPRGSIHSAPSHTPEEAALPDGSLPEGARSVILLRADEPLRVTPDASAARRGSGALGARLPVFGARRGPGCADPWLLVGPEAWVCSTHVDYSAAPPLGAGEGPELPRDGLPHRYHFVGPNGSLAYARLATAEEVAPSFEFQPGFAVALLRSAEKPGTRDRFGLTTHGLWVPLRDLIPAREQVFRGIHLTQPSLDFAWVRRDGTRLFDAPGGRALPREVRIRHELVTVRSERRHRSQLWLEVEPARWLPEEALRRPRRAPPPASLLPGERWVDIDREQQVLVAYEGDTPVFATLVSTGKGPQGSDRITPPGEFRVWVKLRTSDMDNLESESPSLYSIQAVPWVMFFHRGYALHGTFWHRAFGEPRSHGCVNLVPLDAAWLFHWGPPRLPAGWTAALPTSRDPGLLVRVR